MESMDGQNASTKTGLQNFAIRQNEGINGNKWPNANSEGHTESINPLKS